MVMNGLWGGLLVVAGLLTALMFTHTKRPDPEAYATTLTWVRTQLTESSSTCNVLVSYFILRWVQIAANACL
jgi:hypothetical protein